MITCMAHDETAMSHLLQPTDMTRMSAAQSALINSDCQVELSDLPATMINPSSELVCRDMFLVTSQFARTLKVSFVRHAHSFVVDFQMFEIAFSLDDMDLTF